jgi:hypothetical protein
MIPPPPALAYRNLLSPGALQLIDLQATRGTLQNASEVMEACDARLFNAHLDEAARVWLEEERNLRPSPTFSAILSGGFGENFGGRLSPTRHPAIAGRLIHEALRERTGGPGAIDLIVGAERVDELIEGLLVFLCLVPLGNYGKPAFSEAPSERELHLRAQRLPMTAERDAAYRSLHPPAAFSEEGLKTFCWLHVPVPLPQRWVSLPPHKIVSVDHDTRTFRILIAARDQEKYELIWRPAEEDWGAMFPSSFWRRTPNLNQREFYLRFDVAYRLHETTRPFEKALEAAYRTHQVVIGAQNRGEAFSSLAEDLREDLYELLHRHSLGDNLLDDFNKNPDFTRDAHAMVTGWLPRIFSLAACPY